MDLLNKKVGWLNDQVGELYQMDTLLAVQTDNILGELKPKSKNINERIEQGITEYENLPATAANYRESEQIHEMLVPFAEAVKNKWEQLNKGDSVNVPAKMILELLIIVEKFQPKKYNTGGFIKLDYDFVITKPDGKKHNKRARIMMLSREGKLFMLPQQVHFFDLPDNDDGIDEYVALSNHQVVNLTEREANSFMPWHLNEKGEFVSNAKQ